MEMLRSSFRPEFINRIDEIIVFRALTERAAARHHAAARSTGSSAGCGRSGSRSSSPKRRSSSSREEGFDPEFGARPLRRTIQRLVENELSRMVLERRRRARRPVVVSVAGDDLHFDVETGGAAELLDAEEERQEEPARAPA